MRHNRRVTEWVRYRRAEGQPLEAMHAHFERHVYHRHAHETYSFGVTEAGAQQFTCRGGRHTSGAGLVMAFNPDEPHDGRSATPDGFTYRIVHMGRELFDGAAPLFATPVLHDPAAATAIRRLHAALMGPATALARDERLMAAVAAVRRLATRQPRAVPGPPSASRRLAHLVRDQLRAAGTTDLTAEDLARPTGHSRFAVYRAFRAEFGMAPSDYQRQLRLRVARDLITAGRPPAQAAAEAGFADQAHLTRWFLRAYGITPGVYRRATAPS